MRFTLDELANGLGGTVVGVPGTEVTGLVADSREARPGQLFVAISAERDGHDFVPAAMAAGAAAALVDRSVGDGPQLIVDDVEAALPLLATMARDRLPDPVIGVTGSVGKTTTKDLLASVLAQGFVTAASVRSFNNELGVPLTLFNAGDDTTATVVEMGARGSGHIEYLCSMARPSIGVVTTVEAVHTEVMGGLEDIARTKGELIESLPEAGLAVLNADVALVAAMADRTAARVLTFGDSGDVRAADVVIDDELRPSFVLHGPDWSVPVRLAIRGAHNVANALAAAAVGIGVGLSPEQIAAGLGASASSPWRMELSRTASGARVINDAYNAGPASMAAALQSLAVLDADRRVAVLGVMAELGDRSEAEHRRVAELAESLGLELVAVGTDAYGLDPVGGIDEARLLVDSLGEGDAVLLKGSRVAGLERILQP